MITTTNSPESSKDSAKPRPDNGAPTDPSLFISLDSSASSSNGPSVAAPTYAGVTEPAVCHGSKSEVEIPSVDDDGWELVCSLKGNRKSTATSKVSITFGSSSLALTISGTPAQNRFKVLMDHGVDESEIVVSPPDKSVEVLSTDGQQDETPSLVNPDARRWSALDSTPKGSNAVLSAKPVPIRQVSNAASHSLIVDGCKAKDASGPNYSASKNDFKKADVSQAYTKKFYVPPHARIPAKITYPWVSAPIKSKPKSSQYPRPKPALNHRDVKRTDCAVRIQSNFRDRQLNQAIDEHNRKLPSYTAPKHPKPTSKPIEYERVALFDKAVNCAVKRAHKSTEVTHRDDAIDLDIANDVLQFEQNYDLHNEFKAPAPSIVELCKGLHRKGMSAKSVTYIWMQAGGKPEKTPLCFELIARKRARMSSGPGNDTRRRHSQSPD